jgi:hypothetical protein
MTICQTFKRKVEEKLEEPIRRRKLKFKEKCRRKKCRRICLCCNKWFCSISWVFYWVVEYVVRIVVKWVPYVVCRILSSVISLVLIGLYLAWLAWCAYEGRDRQMTVEEARELSDIRLRPMRTLEIEVVIIDKSESIRNPITPNELDARIADANRIYKERAHIEVKRVGEIRRDVSASLYELEGTDFPSKSGEWFKLVGLVLGRDNPVRATVYAVGRVGEGDTQGRHHAPFGSVFTVAGASETSLAHELGHLLGHSGHSTEKGNLMEATAAREDEVSWPKTTPHLTVEQWCSMRKSRWLKWTAKCERCP